MGHLIPPEPQWPGYDPSDFALRRDLPYLEEQREGAPGDLMNEPVEQEKAEKLKRSNWWWPGVVASSLAGAAVLVFRGCWHGKRTWPIFRPGYFSPGFLSPVRQQPLPAQT